MDRYTVIQRLGSGACGAVYLVREAESKKLFALKKIEIDERKKNRAKDAILKEANILSKLKHPHVVAFHDSFLDEGQEHVIIIQDFCDGGTLAEKIQAAMEREENFDEKDIMCWFVQIVMGVQYIHSQKVLHRDLKAENVFLTKKNIVKIGDFGISKIMDNTIDVAKTVVGTPSYLSPELCQDIPYNSKSDMWAVGCVLYEMCALRQPFDSNNLLRLFLKIINEKHDPLPGHCSEALRELVDSLLEKSPENRPSASAILNKAFVRRHLAVFISEKELQQQQQSLRGTLDAGLRSVSPLVARQSGVNSSALPASSCSSPQQLSPLHRGTSRADSRVGRSQNLSSKDSQKTLTSPQAFPQVRDSPPTPLPTSPLPSAPPLSPPPSMPSPAGDGPCSPKSALPKLKRPKLKKRSLTSEGVAPQAPLERPASASSARRAQPRSPLKPVRLAGCMSPPPPMDLSPRSAAPELKAQSFKAEPQRLRANVEPNGVSSAGDGARLWSGGRDSIHPENLTRNAKRTPALEPIQHKVTSNHLPESADPYEAEEKAASDYSDDFDDTDSDIEEEIAEDLESSEGDVEYADDFEEYDDSEELAAIVDQAREAQGVEASDDYFEDPEGHGYSLAQSVDLAAAQQSLLSSSLNRPRAHPSLPPLHSPPPSPGRPSSGSPIKGKAGYIPSSPK